MLNSEPAPPTTPGREALAEAARIESARIYGNTQPEHRSHPVQPAVDDEAVLDEALARAERRRAERDRAVRAGRTNSQIIAEIGCDYAEIQAARKRNAAV